jgi:protein TonB
MNAIALPQAAFSQWNWPRVGALSGAVSLHFAVMIALLIPPTAMTLLRPAVVDVTHARLLDPPRRFEEPPLPKPPEAVHEVRRKPIPAPAPAPVAPPVLESKLPAQQADPAPPRRIAPAAPVDAAPTALAYNTRTAIAYPREAFRLRQQGTVILDVLVGADGVPQRIEIGKSSGSRSLDAAARDAVSRWTFQSGTRNGVATALWARVPVTFELQTL